jgi:hypothetical protein
VVESERRYIAERECKAQDTYMLDQCLMASLTSEAKKKVIIWADQYQTEVDGAKYSSGVALLKFIICESHLDTNATTNQICTKLSALDTYITTINSDIGKFNQYVKLLVQSLLARNQTTSDLLINLFKGYGAVSDETFRAWLIRKQDDHEEGNPITPDELMLAAKNKYDAMVDKGTWNAPTAEEKIVALKAKLTSTMKSLNKNKVTHEMNKKGNAKSKSTGGGNKKRSKGDSETKHPKTWPAPKPGDKKVAKFNGFDWYWCGKDTGGMCEKWRAHKPKDCMGKAAARRDEPDKATSPKQQQSEGKKGKDSIAKKLKIAKAYVAKMEQKAAEMEITDDDDSE